MLTKTCRVKVTEQLMVAAENGHVDITRLLLDVGADKDLHGFFGQTALMVAAALGRWCRQTAGEWLWPNSPHGCR